MTPPFIPFDAGEARLDWLGLTDVLADGHQLPKAEIEDSLLYRGDDTVLSRAAWIDGLGIAVKTATIFPGNAQSGTPTLGGAVVLLSDADGSVEAYVDFHLVTKWKTVGDSLLAARHLAPDHVRKILIVGSGTVANGLRQGYEAIFPSTAFTVWSRTASHADAFAQSYPNTQAATDLEAAVRDADIVASATMSTAPLIHGDWMRPGQHIDLIGAYRPDMREVDDTAIARARLFVDSFDTTVGHIGEVKTPIEAGVISRDDVLADFYDLPAFTREPKDLTIFKNGGGAHLDLMTARYILGRFSA